MHTGTYNGRFLLKPTVDWTSKLSLSSTAQFFDFHMAQEDFNYARSNTLVVTAFAACILLLVALAIATFVYTYCGRRREYNEIQDADEGPDAEMSTGKTSYVAQHELQQGNIKNTKLDAASVLVLEIDYIVRHMEGFYAPGFYCSVVALEKQMNLPPKLGKKSILEFIRKRPEFRMRSNMSAFKVTRLTPFREPNLQVYGKFQCVNAVCKHKWDSLCTFADHYQKCKRCSARVYPYEQASLTADEMSEYKNGSTCENFKDRADIAKAAR